MSIELNWAQKEALPAIAADLQAGHKKLYVDMPTRSGKTGIPLTMLETFAQQGILPSTTIVTDRKVLVRNIIKDAALFAPTLIKNNLIQAHTSASLRKASTPPLVRVMTYAGRTAAVLDGTLNPEEEMFIVEDEGQHRLSDLRSDTHGRNPDAIHLALTASPEYSQEKGLPQAGYKRSYHLSRQRAIDRKLNAQVRSVVVEMENIKGSLDDISSMGGDFSPQELEKLVSQTEVMENIGQFMEHYHSPVDPRKIVERSGFIFCNSIADSIATANYLNKRFGQNTCGAAWGNMGINQDEIIRAHDSGKIRFLASADFAVEGYGNKKHDVVINKAASKSGVRVKQRGGRPTEYDEGNPDKEALIADFVYPSEKGEQLLFGDAEGGFLFESSTKHHHRGSKKYPVNLTPAPLLSGLKIHSTPETTETFLHRRAEKRTKYENRHLEVYTEAVRNRMIKTGLLSLDSVWKKVEEFIDNTNLQDKEKFKKRGKGSFGRNTIRNLMIGGASYGDSKYRQYSGAAIALATVLGTHPKVLFGGLNQSKEKSDKNILSEIEYGEDDLAFAEPDIDPIFNKSAHYEEEEVQPLSLSSDDYSTLLNEGDGLDEIEQSIDYEVSELVEESEHQLNVMFPDDEEYERALETWHVMGENKKERTYVTGDFLMGNLRPAVDPFDNYVAKERDETVTQVLNTLTPRQERILRM